MYEERTGKSWNICLAPKQPKSGVYLKGGYRYFVAKTGRFKTGVYVADTYER